MIDVNVYLSQWPFRRLPLDDDRQFAEYLAKVGVRQAWAASFDGVLHRDVAGVNQRLAAACRKHSVFLPVGTINPALPDWQDDVRRCRQQHGMKVVRLHPNYHGYTLADPRFAKLLGLCSEQGLIVQLAVKMEDERTQHPLVQVPAVDTTPLIKILPDYPQLPIVLLNSLRNVRFDQADQLAKAGKVYFEIAMLEAAGGIEKLLKSLPLERLLFGSYCPFFYFRSAQLKLKESSLPFAVRQAITRGNVEKLQR